MFQANFELTQFRHLHFFWFCKIGTFAKKHGKLQNIFLKEIHTNLTPNPTNPKTRPQINEPVELFLKLHQPQNWGIIFFRILFRSPMHPQKNTDFVVEDCLRQPKSRQSGLAPLFDLPPKWVPLNDPCPEKLRFFGNSRLRVCSLFQRLLLLNFTGVIRCTSSSKITIFNVTTTKIIQVYKFNSKNDIKILTYRKASKSNPISFGKSPAKTENSLENPKF